MKINIKNKDLPVIKLYIQLQTLIETLDDVTYNSTHELKQYSNRYLRFLEKEAKIVIDSMHKTNPTLFNDMMNDVRIGINKIENNFICQE